MQGVRARAAFNRVVAKATRNQVCAVISGQAVVVVRPGQILNACKRISLRVPAGANDRPAGGEVHGHRLIGSLVGSGVPGGRVPAAVDQIAPCAADQAVIVRAAKQSIAALEPGNRVVAAQAGDQFPLHGAGEIIVTRIPRDGRAGKPEILRRDEVVINVFDSDRSAGPCHRCIVTVILDCDIAEVGLSIQADPVRAVHEIRDRIGAMAGSEHECVGVGAAGKAVVPRSAGDNVAARAAQQRIVAAKAGNRVVAAAAGAVVVLIISSEAVGRSVIGDTLDGGRKVLRGNDQVRARRRGPERRSAQNIYISIACLQDGIFPPVDFGGADVNSAIVIRVKHEADGIADAEKLARRAACCRSRVALGGGCGRSGACSELSYCFEIERGRGRDSGKIRRREALYCHALQGDCSSGPCHHGIGVRNRYCYIGKVGHADQADQIIAVREIHYRVGAMARAECESIAAAAAGKPVISFSAIQTVRACPAAEHVGARAAKQRVVARIAVQCIVARCAHRHVVPAPGVHHVVTRQRLERLACVPARQCVGPGRA